MKRFVALTAALALSGAALGQTWDESLNGGGDAGEALGAAQQVPSGETSLSAITGSYVSGECDVYEITICDPANFSATTSNNGTTIDTQLWLFNLDGTGIVADDDNPAGGLQSFLSNSFTAGLPAGRYLLGISGYNRDPYNAASQLLWANTPFNVERAPDGPGAGTAYDHWTGTNAAGNYRIDLTGVCFTPGVMYPSGVGAASPNSLTNCGGDTTLLTVSVTPGNPPGDPFSVSADLSSIGGLSSQQFFDDGTHGDASPNDNIFSFGTVVGYTVSAGAKTLPFTITDSLNRTANGNIALTVTACAQIGACCLPAGCQVISQIACEDQAGTYNGDGTDCGVVSYDAAQGGDNFEDISGSGFLSTASNCDDCVEQNIPLGFDFAFFGTTYNAINISSNGNLQFAPSASTAFTNTAIPNPALPNNMVAPFWDDLNPGVQGEVYYQTVGSAPNRRFIAQWNNVTQFALTTSETFEAVLQEGSNDIQFRYLSVTPEATAGDYTIGVENADGTVAFSIPGANIGGGDSAYTFGYRLSSDPCVPQCPWSAGGCVADYNGSGGTPDDADIAAFFSAWNSGDECADANQSGGTPDDADIATFFQLWNNGGC